jgi:hypothetical protein
MAYTKISCGQVCHGQNGFGQCRIWAAAMALCRREQLPCEWTLSGSPLQSLAKDIAPRGLPNTKQLDKDCLTLFTDLQHMVTCAQVMVTSSGSQNNKTKHGRPKGYAMKTT